MTLKITLLLLAFLLVFVKTSESKSLRDMQRVKYKNSKNTNFIKRSENNNGGGNGVVRCNDHNECPAGFACLLPGFEQANSKANKRCYQCNCTDPSQCFFQDKQMKCDCCGSGFTGQFCQINIDDCINAVCLNGATCEDSVNDYTCHCTPGFTGTHCEIDIDDCTSASCLNNGTCVDLVNDYTCQCTPGFTGTNCGIDIDDCINAVCLNGATCEDFVNDYTCHCTPGFTGTHCEIDIDDCTSASCLNGATCVDLVNDHTCQCTPGFTGTNCGIDIDDCINAVCLNGANCEDFVNDYTCHCTPGFTGTHCEIDIDDCTSASCLNGATCVDLVNGYTCCCAPGFTGTHCEIDIDDCINAVCLNNGTCEDLVNAHTCQCTPGFTGTVCESVYKDPCLPGWFYDRNSCYLYVSTTFNWLSAVSYCQSLDPNAYLVEITDSAENTLVYIISNYADVWIGLSDSNSEGNFYWEYSGDNLIFTPGYLYYSGSDSRDCVFMHGTHWDVGYCSNNRPIVCEMPEQ